ncbi:MAG: nuclease-related domain-containing protein [Deinococcota bacterium]
MLSSLRRNLIRKRAKTRSPLKEKDVASLRYPGQSIQMKMDDISIDLDGDAVAIIAALITCFISWYNYFFPSSRFVFAISMSILAFGFSGVLVPTGILRWRKILRLRDARNGERIVAEHLNQLMADGYTVLHDIPCHESKKRKRKVIFNIDHLLVEPAGIFAVETKTMRKLDNGKDYKLTFNGKEILRFGKPLKHDPIKQSVDQARWLENELLNSTNKRFNVTPVVTFPGWYMTFTAPPTKIKVLGTPKPQVLRGILNKQPTQLTDEDIALIIHRIKLQIQTAPL